MIRTITLAAFVALTAVASYGPALAQQAMAIRCDREFITYFPSSKADFASGTAEVIKQAVTFGGADATYTVTGHTDGVEPVGVSLQRTIAVNDALVKDGIKAGNIKIDSVAADAPAVPTQAPEPLNRRATICVSRG